MTQVERRAAAAAASRRYYHRNPERCKAARRLWYAKNRKVANEIGLRSHHKDPVRKLFNLARDRAKKRGLAFSITHDDVVIPARCPVLGIVLAKGRRGFHDASPTLDRIENARGYVPGNVIVVSWRANRIKCDATLVELRVVADFYSHLINGKARP